MVSVAYVVDITIEQSLDSGVTWTPLAGLSAAGGDLLNKLGQPVTENQLVGIPVVGSDVRIVATTYATLTTQVNVTVS